MIELDQEPKQIKRKKAILRKVLILFMKVEN